MLKFNLQIIFAFTALLIVLTGCSTTPKEPDVAASSQDDDMLITKRPGNWQRNHLVELSPTELDSSLYQDESVEVAQIDLWERLRHGYGVDGHRVIRPETQKRLTWLVEHPEYIDRLVERARPYLYYIVNELDKRNMPTEIALIPAIESGFKPLANSYSGAAGIWQFIPSTGKVFGLEQTWWYDGRRDIIRSTDAALDYLEKLHGYFGDWQLAIAAYNGGEGTVLRAIKANQQQGKPTDFWSLDLRPETAAYIPKLLAMANLIKQPAQYDIRLKPIDNMPYLAEVDAGSQIDLALAADLADISEEKLHLLNPGYNRWATAPDGPHKLLVPVNKAAAFKAALANVPANQRLSWQRHKVASGESLGQIAKQHQTSINSIKKANKLTTNFIRAGAHLMIPVASVRAETEPTRISTAQGIKSAYIVQSGDSWWQIARKHAVDVSDLASWNNKTPKAPLHQGQSLVVWQPDKSKIKHQSISYTIQSGDSLWKISRKFKVSVAQVKAWNNLSDRSLLQPGQQLTLYIKNS